MHNPKTNNYKNHPVYNRLLSSGPKRILSLDGGGIRGALTLGYLVHIEQLLRDRYGKEDLVLSDYFDLVGGTSTGGIIATLIALGWPVAKIKALYMELGPKIFKRRKHPLNWWKLKYVLSSEYSHTLYERILSEDRYLGTKTLGSKDFKTGLALFAKRADTFSTWAFHNHPRNAFYEQNKNLLMKDLVRATSAAPTYFQPKEITLSDQQAAIFIDGGVSMVNNPALMLFLMATIKSYGYNWHKGADHLQIVSVGTGYGVKRIQKKDKNKLLKRCAIGWAQEVPDMFMADAVELNQVMLQYMSNPAVPVEVDRAIGDLSDELLTSQPLLQYIRYNSPLTEHHLRSIDVKLSGDVNELIPMDRPQNAERLFEIGEKDGARLVKAAHYDETFDYGLNRDTVMTQAQAMERFKKIIEDRGRDYQKHGQVTAQQTTQEEEVISITKYGIETRNIAQIGDYILTNNTRSQEKYAVTEEVFNKRYESINTADEGKKLYQAIGTIIGIQLTPELLQELSLKKHGQLIADWGAEQYYSVGDYIVMPTPQKNEVYRIGKEEFMETYRLI